MRASQKPRAATAAALAAVLALAAAPAARADVGETIILRCTHGQSLAGFTPSDYARALRELSADAEEYTECGSLIRQAQLAAAGGRRGATAGAEAAPLLAGPSERSALESARTKRPAALEVGGRLVRPGVIHADIASALSSLPTPLLAALALVLAGVALGGALGLRNRIRGRDQH